MSDAFCSAGMVPLNEKQKKQFEIYRQKLISYNEVMNLTAVPDDEIETRHFADSLSLLTTNKLFEGASLIDVGTGAGFPGLPLAIARPDLSVTLLDSLHKRTEFLEAVTCQAEVLNTKVLCSRAEDAAQKEEYREKYDLAVSRAVAKLSVLCEYCLPFVRIGGYFLAMKGPDAKDEISTAQKAIETLGGSIEAVEKTAVDIKAGAGTIVIIKKVGQTPTKYPRRAGKPTKNPIE